MEEGSCCVLLLHPYGSSGKVFEKKSASFLKLMGLKGAVVAPDAPHRMDGKEDANRWFRFGGVDPSIDAPIEEYLCSTFLEGVEESILALRRVVSKRVCEGWVCFSQGAAFASLLLATLKADDELWYGLKWMVLASHFDVPTYTLVDGCMLNSSRMVPTLHLAGTEDIYVPLHLTMKSFEERYKQSHPQALFLAHDGKHHLPSKGAYRKALTEWLLQIQNGV